MDYVVLIDADSLIWETAYHSRTHDNRDEACSLIDQKVISILFDVKATHYWGFLQKSGRGFRAAINPSYKGNRPETPDWKKRWDPILREHLLKKWVFIEVQDIETDDAVASAARVLEGKKIKYVICSRDKDLDQIPGPHYDPRTKEQYIVRNPQLRFWQQTLSGDSTDNVPGLKGFGEKTSVRLLAPIPTELWGPTVLRQYIKAGQRLGRSEIESAILFAETILQIGLQSRHNEILTALSYIKSPTTDVFYEAQEEKRSFGSQADSVGA
jgi:5'-3' exonuclease